MNTLTIEEIQKKIEEVRKGNVDLSTEEDLAIAVMNLISLEEHFFFTAEKTGNADYYTMLHEIREMRKVLLGRMITKTDGESWCISKHLLATTMRLMEVGTKLQHDGKHDEAKQTFHYAYSTFNMFFALRLKIVGAQDVGKAASAGEMPQTPMSLDDIMKNLVNCCKE